MEQLQRAVRESDEMRGDADDKVIEQFLRGIETMEEPLRSHMLESLPKSDLLRVGDPAPHAILHTLDGGTISLHDLFQPDRLTVVNFGSIT